jgi:hypothetical protein
MKLKRYTLATSIIQQVCQCLKNVKSHVARCFHFHMSSIHYSEDCRYLLRHVTNIYRISTENLHRIVISSGLLQ